MHVLPQNVTYFYMKKQNVNGYTAATPLVFHSNTPPSYVTRNPLRLHPFSPLGNSRFPNLFSVVPNHEAMAIRHGPTVGWMDRWIDRRGRFVSDGSCRSRKRGMFFSGGVGCWGGKHGGFTGKEIIVCCSFQFR